MAKRVQQLPQAVETSSVNVVVRLRPPLNKNSNKDDHSVRGIDNKTVELWNQRNDRETLSYQFDAFIDETVSQSDLFRSVIEPFCVHCLNGQNGSVFAYGPTGAGKTHTMVGPVDHPGIIPRSAYQIFTSISKYSQDDCPEWEFDVRFSYLEIYREKVCDLLDTKKSDLKIHQDRENNILVPGLTEQEVTSFDEFELYFNVANSNRQTAVTKLNERSSRSHAVLLLKVERKQTRPPFRKLTGKMYLIDLAGSEDNRKTGNVGLRLKESGAINTSLFALNQVIDAIRSRSSYIPYRHSKLTRLLQDSLGGSAHACMIANIAPEYLFYTDTHQTLNFASKSRDIINQPFTKETIGNRRPLSDISTAQPPAKSRRRAASSQRTSDTINIENHAETQRIIQTQAEIVNDITNMKTQLAEMTARSAVPSKPVAAVIPRRTTSSAKTVETSPEISKKNLPVTASYTVNQKKYVEGKVEFQVDNATKDEIFGEMVSFLNSADVSTLTKTLYGVAQKRAQAIVSWRQAVGVFHTIDDLEKIPGFSRRLIHSITQHYLVKSSSF